MEKKIVQKVIAGCLVLNNNKVLIIQRSSDEHMLPNKWEFPSGKKEPMEKVEDAAVRECKEETNLDVEVVKPIGVFNFGWERENEIRDATEIVFLVKIKGSANVKLSDEHQNFAWIGIGEINKYDMSDETKNIAVEVLSNI